MASSSRETIKTSSSAWIKKQGNAHRSFFWQRGYGASSEGFSQLDSLIHYIDTQEEHHRTKTFQEEYRELLRKYSIEFDERYVWPTGWEVRGRLVTVG